MDSRKCFRCLCFASGILFLFAPFLQLLGFVRIAFPNGEWVALNPIKAFFGGGEEILNEGNAYYFSYRFNPFFIGLIALSFIAALGSFFGKYSRKNRLFSFFAGFLALVIASFGVLIFCWHNPGFSLDGMRVGVGFVLSVCCYSLALLTLLASLVFSKK